MDHYRQLELPYKTVVVAAAALAAFYMIAIIQALWADGVSAEFANKDFANYWTAGKLILNGGTADLFGPQPDYFRHLTAAFGEDYPWHNWSYPPHYLLLLWPLGFFGYEVAMVLFLLVTGGLFVWALRNFADTRETWFILLFAATPLIAHNIWTAQNGFLTAGLAIGALALRAERPILAGILLGLLTVKPQLGILFPFLLLAERRWTVIASAAATAVALVALSSFLFGFDAWRGYLSEVVPYQQLVMRELQGTFLWMLPSIYGTLRLWGLAADSALAAHLVVAVPVFLVTIAAFWLVKEAIWRSVLLLIATFLITPYALSYDLGMAAAAVGMMMVMSKRDGWDRRPTILLAIAIGLPIVMMPLGDFGVPLAPAILLAVYVLALMKAGVFERARLLIGGKNAVPAPGE
ncbi:MAG: glycosyltransferase family 87 protein [Rhizobiaceae bacterium]